MFWLSAVIQERLAYVLAHFVWQGLALAALLALVVSLCGIKRPQVRYGLSLITFLLMTACPIVTWSLAPEFSPLPEPLSASAVVADFARTQAMQANADIDAATFDTSNNTADFNALPPNAELRSPAFRTELSQENIVAPSAADQSPNTPADTHWIRHLRPYETWIIGAWLSGVGLLSLRLLCGAIGLWRWRRTAESVPEWLVPIVARLCESMSMWQPSVRVCRRVTEAVALGLFKPMILLPAAWLTELPPDMLEAVLAHELAHIRRLDLWVNLFQRLVETVLFYHPAVWWLSRRLRMERELCCDECAANLMQDRVRYAEMLEQVARMSRLSASSNLSLAVGSRDGHLLQRVRHILEPAPQRSGLSAGLAGLLSLACVLAVSVSIGSQTQLASPDAQPDDVAANEQPEPTASVTDAALETESAPVVVDLPNGRSFELVGITKNTAVAKDGWKPDGTPIGDVGHWPSTIVLHDKGSSSAYAENGSHPEPDADAIDLLVRFRGLKEQPSLTFDMATIGSSYHHLPLKDPYEFRVSTRRRGEPSPGGKWGIPDGEVRVGLTDEPWGKWVQISPAGEVLNPSQPGERHHRYYDKVLIHEVIDHERAPNKKALVLCQPKDASSLYNFEIRGIDEDAKPQWVLEWEGRGVKDTDLKTGNWGLATPEKKPLARYEFRLRPYRHWVTISGVQFAPGKPSKIETSVKTIPDPDHPANESAARSQAKSANEKSDVRAAENSQDIPRRLHFYNEHYSAVGVMSGDEVNFVLAYSGFISTGMQDWVSGSPPVQVWGFDGNIHLVDREKTRVARKNVDKRKIAVKYTSAAPHTLFLDGKAFDLTKSGRLFILRDDGELLQTDRTLPLRDQPDLAPIGKAIRDLDRPATVSELPDGRKFELVAVAHASVVTKSGTQRMADGWWKADGTPFDKAPFEKLQPLSVAAGKRHFREVVIRLATRPKELASPENAKRPAWNGDVWWGARQEVLSAVAWDEGETVESRVGLQARPTTDLQDGWARRPALLHQAIVGFEEEQPATVSFYYTTAPSIVAGTIAPDGKITASESATEPLKAWLRDVKVASVEQAGKETVVKLNRSYSQIMSSQVVVNAIALDGTIVTANTPHDSDRAVFKLQLADIDAFQIVVRPMTHRVDCEDIALAPGQKCQPRVIVTPLDECFSIKFLKDGRTLGVLSEVRPEGLAELLKGMQHDLNSETGELIVTSHKPSAFEFAAGIVKQLKADGWKWPTITITPLENVVADSRSQADPEKGTTAKPVLRERETEPQDGKPQDLLLKLTLRVVDAATQKPIKNPKAVFSFKEHRWWETAPKLTTDEGQVRWEGTRDEAIQWRVMAKGYRPAITRLITLDEKEVTLDVPLERDPGISGRVIGADGQPVAGAMVRLTTRRSEAQVSRGELVWHKPLPGFQFHSVETDFDGNFTLPAETDPYAIVVTSKEHGFAAMTQKAVVDRSNVTISLQKWMRLEGTIQRSGMPLSGELLRVPYSRALHDSKLEVRFDEDATTGDDGRFIIERVEPGRVPIGQWKQKYEPSGSSRSLIEMFHVEGRPGQVIQFTMGNQQRTAVGRLKVAGRDNEPAGPTPDWSRYRLTLEDVPGADGQKSHRDVKLESDGRFRIEQIQAGDYSTKLEPMGNDPVDRQWGYWTHGISIPLCDESEKQRVVEVEEVAVYSRPRRKDAQPEPEARKLLPQSKESRALLPTRSQALPGNASLEALPQVPSGAATSSDNGGGAKAEPERKAVPQQIDRVRGENKDEARRVVPRVDGKVLDTTRNDRKKLLVEISVGLDDGLREGDVLHVLRPAKLPEERKPVAQIRLEEVKPNSSVGVVINEENGTVIKKGDDVQAGAQGTAASQATNGTKTKSEHEAEPPQARPQAEPGNEKKAQPEHLPEVVGSLVRASVTLTRTNSKTGLPDPNPNGQAGAIVDARGFILTQLIVADADHQWRVRDNDRNEYLAEFVASEPQFQLSVLRIKPTKALPAVTKFAKAKPDERLISVPSPAFRYARQGTVTYIGQRLRTGFPEHLIQTSFPVELGEEGGLVANRAGDAIGIFVNDDHSHKGTNFAVPLDDVIPFLKKAIPEFAVADDRGRVAPQLGAESQSDSATAKKNDGVQAPLPLLEFRVAAQLPDSQFEPRVPKDFEKREYPGNSVIGRLAAKDKGFVWVGVADSKENIAPLPVERPLASQAREALLADTPEHALAFDGKWKIADCRAVPDPSGGQRFMIELKLDAAGGEALKALTKSHLNQPLAIVVNNKILAAPIIRSEIGQSIAITGNFTREQADQLASQLTSNSPMAAVPNPTRSQALPGNASPEALPQAPSAAATPSDNGSDAKTKPRQEAEPPKARPQAEPGNELVDPNGEIHGVLLGKDGQPVVGATVACGAVINDSARGGGSNSVTDEQGRYRLKVPSPGIYNVWLKSAGAAGEPISKGSATDAEGKKEVAMESQPTWTAAADEGLFVEGGKVTTSRMQLIRGTMISGTLVDSGDQPLSRVTVYCYSLARPQSGASVQTVLADEKGEFKFWLVPGRAYVYATGKELGRAAANIEVPRNGRPEPIEPLKLVLKHESIPIGGDSWLQQSSTGTQIVRQEKARDVTGTVVDSDGKPISGAKVFRYDGPIVTTNDNGEFTVRADKGTQFIMYAAQPGYRVWFGTPTAGDVLKIVLDKKPENADITTTPPTRTPAQPGNTSPEAPPRRLPPTPATKPSPATK